MHRTYSLKSQVFSTAMEQLLMTLLHTFFSHYSQYYTDLHQRKCILAHSIEEQSLAKKMSTIKTTSKVTRKLTWNVHHHRHFTPQTLWKNFFLTLSSPAVLLSRIQDISHSYKLENVTWYLIGWDRKNCDGIFYNILLEYPCHHVMTFGITLLEALALCAKYILKQVSRYIRMGKVNWKLYFGEENCPLGRKIVGLMVSSCFTALY